LSAAALSCKTSDRGIDNRGVSDGPVHEVELLQGSPHGLRSASPTRVSYSMMLFVDLSVYLLNYSLAAYLSLITYGEINMVN
jgi:hypothetical protein